MKMLTLKELAVLSGYSFESVQRWRNQGLKPIPKTRPMRFDFDQVIAWLVKQKMFTQAAKLKAAVPSKEKNPTLKPSPKCKDITDLNEFANGVRFSESFCRDMMMQATVNSPAEAQWWIEIYQKAAEERRKLEKDLADIQLTQSRVRPVEEIQYQFSQVGIMIKTRMLAIPNAVAGICEGRKAAEIAELLREEITGALKELSDNA